MFQIHHFYPEDLCAANDQYTSNSNLKFLDVFVRTNLSFSTFSSNLLKYKHKRGKL